MVYRRDERAARARLALGLMLHEIGKDACAAEVFRAGLSYDPKLVEAYVALGFAYGRLIQYEEMVGAFAEAIRFDRTRAIEAACEEPPEVRQIKGILYGPPDPLTTEEISRRPAVPPAVLEASQLVGSACKYLGDTEAVDALERAVRLDSASADGTSMLAFAYLLLAEDQRAGWAGESVLWVTSPWLARFFFGY